MLTERETIHQQRDLTLAGLHAIGYIGTWSLLRTFPIPWILDALADIAEARAAGADIRNPSGMLNYLLRQRAALEWGGKHP
ncbi:MAG: hypothetical protein ACYC3S_18080 [Chloroflexota bacterium]